MNDQAEKMLEAKVCEACGERFGCGAKMDGCWCSELYVSSSSAEELKDSYGDCLCPKCLGMRSEKPAIVITYPDGKIEVIDQATRVDTQNFHEGMFDFYDQNGTLLRQIDMGSGISWREIGPVSDR
jgi:hypothetical protein